MFELKLEMDVADRLPEKFEHRFFHRRLEELAREWAEAGRPTGPAEQEQPQVELRLLERCA